MCKNNKNSFGCWTNQSLLYLYVYNEALNVLLRIANNQEKQDAQIEMCSDTRSAVCIRNSIDDKCNYISNEYYAHLATHMHARLK